MGAQASLAQANTEIITNAINDSIIETAKSCSGFISQKQTLSVGGDVSITGDNTDLSFTQSSSVNLKCLQENISITELRNIIEQEIKNKLVSGNSGQNIGGQLSMSNVSNSLITDVVNNIGMSDIQNCSNDIEQTQSRIIGGDLSVEGRKVNLSSTQTSEIISNCMQKNESLVSSISDLSNSVANDVSSTNAGFIGGGAVVLILIIILIGMGIYTSQKGKKTN